jgi:colanic acid biosynthesis glycosyl transferase WcaI
MDGVLTMSPPLPLGLVGRVAALVHGAPLVFNVQDIFPDVAVQLGKLTDPRLVRAAERLERMTYEHAAAITVLSEDLRANVVAKVRPSHRDAVRVIPNFVDTDVITPLDRQTVYRRELAISAKQTVVLYAGNVGFSQSLDVVVAAARQLRDRSDVVFVINGGGSGLAEVMASSDGLPNVRFAPYQPRGRLAEVLATGDIHVVPLRKGLATSSVPSKTYSTLAAGRPLLAAIDAGTEVARVVAEARCGVAVPPDDPAAFLGALTALLDDQAGRTAMGERGRAWVERWISPAAVARAYEDLFLEVGGRAR